VPRARDFVEYESRLNTKVACNPPISQGAGLPGATRSPLRTHWRNPIHPHPVCGISGHAQIISTSVAASGWPPKYRSSTCLT